MSQFLLQATHYAFIKMFVENTHCVFDKVLYALN